MILLRAGLVRDLDTIPKLRGALQSAVELEHATIPTYLYALYSLKPGTNREIGLLLRSVVLEEMTHMALACNMLNALGGSPCIDSPAFVPAYPGALPGGVEGGLTVPLSRFSIKRVENVFMQIEEPEDPHEYPVKSLAAQDSYTIGQFYANIDYWIGQATDAAFVGNPGRQLTHELGPENLIEVTDVASASAAIRLIVEQGEGTSKSPLDEEGALAHYYRFAEIAKGRNLVEDSSAKGGYSYSGDRIPFDPDGVYPVVENPTPYPEGSAARYADDTFNYTYTALLRALHQTFNGDTAKLDAAIGLMESCKQLAMDMMTIDLGDGTVAGPAFRYQPTNPEV